MKVKILRCKGETQMRNKSWSGYYRCKNKTKNLTGLCSKHGYQHWKVDIKG